MVHEEGKMRNIIVLVVGILLLTQTAFARLPDEDFKFWDTSNIEFVVTSVKNMVLLESDLEKIKKEDPVRYNKIDGFARAVFFGSRLLAEEPRYKTANDAAIAEYAQSFMSLGIDIVDNFIRVYRDPSQKATILKNMTATIYQDSITLYSKDYPNKIKQFDELSEFAFVLYQAVASRIYTLKTLGAAKSSYELDNKISDFLIGISSDLNKQCPMNVDRFIILKNSMVDGKTLIYRYQTNFQDLIRWTFDTYGRTVTISDLEEGFKIAGLKDDCLPDDPFFKIGASIGRYYYDEENNLKIKVITSKEDCLSDYAK